MDTSALLVILEGESEPESPERIETRTVASDPAGLDLDRVEQALREADVARSVRQRVAGRLMQMAATGYTVTAVGLDAEGRVVLDVSNGAQDVVA